MANYYFMIPFGTSGDKTAVPIPTQGDGAISYTQGYGPNYSAPRDTDPAALTIERNKMNQLFFAITSGLQQYQQHGTPEFITSADNGGSAYGYSKYARIRWDNGSEIADYVSLVASNTTNPTSTPANWSQLRIDPAYLGVAQTFNAAQKISSAGAPLTLCSTNSANPKLVFQDVATTNRGGIGSSSTMPISVYLANLTTLVGGWDTSGYLIPGAAATYDVGTAALQWRAVFSNRVEVLGSTIPTNGIYLPAANTVGVAASSTLVASFTTTGMNNTVIGATTAANGTFTALVAGSTTTLNGATNNLGSSTSTSTMNIAYGATVNAAIKTVNIGTGGVSGSTTNIAIGSATAGAGGALTINLPVTAKSISLTDSTVPANGLYLPAANTLGFAANTTKAGSIDSTQQWGIGNFTPFSNSGMLQVYRGVTGGNPASAGAADSNQIALFMAGNPTVYGLRIGMFSSGAVWLQQSNVSNYGTNANISLNPNGGGVLVSELLTTGLQFDSNNVRSIGTGANVALNLIAKGAESVNISNGQGFLLYLTNSASTVNYYQINSTAAGSSPTINVIGADANINFVANSKGTGVLQCLGTYTNSTTGTANLIINASGNIQRTTSMRKYKKDIEPVEVDRAIHIAENLNPVWFRSKCPGDDPLKSHYSFIADEVALLDKRLVHYGLEPTDMFDENGTPILGSEVAIGVQGERILLMAFVAHREQIRILQNELAEVRALLAM